MPVAGEPADKADKSEPDDQPASAMAGAMLVLLGSSVAGLPPVAGGAAAVAGALAQAGKTVASDARAATMLQLGAAGSPAAAPVTYIGTPQEQWEQGQKAYEAWSAARPRTSANSDANATRGPGC